ncbi:MAG: SDR family oxidoreductase [Planctomycetota bacterium]|jgi:NAD(P)-dependent dehydrogenase (short-subunit alcohol dehydrogenase family)
MPRKELDIDLSGEVVAITGGGGALCGRMATALAARGAAVGVLDISEEAAREVAEQIIADGGQALALTCDVLHRDQVLAAAQRIAAELGAPTALINGAGGNKAEATTTEERSFFQLPPEAVRRVLDLNFVATFLCSQVFGEIMTARGSGSIINISSMNAFRPLTRIPAYSAAKGAVSNFTQWLAVHINRNYGAAIRVNALAPGFFLTEQNRFLLVDQQSGSLTPRGKTIIEHTPMARFGEPDDLIGTLLWLLSDSSRFVNGVIIPVDGGFSAFSGV